MHINILEYLEESARKMPSKTAFSDINNEISFENLEIRAKNIGSYVSDILKGETNQPIVVTVDRTIESLITYLGLFTAEISMFP